MRGQRSTAILARDVLMRSAAGRLRCAFAQGVEGWRSRARSPALRFRDLRLDPTTREVYRGGRQIELTPIEFSLLELFLRCPEQVLSRGEILTHVWGFDFGSSSNSLNVYMGYLRRKLEAAGEPRLIHTIRGVGYVLRGRANGS
jgi:two-component system, OmpR family, response regulator MprA